MADDEKGITRKPFGIGALCKGPFVEDGRLNLWVRPQMVEYQAARNVFACLGMAMHRRNDEFLDVKFKSPHPDDDLKAPFFDGKDPDASVLIHGGYYTDVGVMDGKCRTCYRGEELLSFMGFLKVLVAMFEPDFKSFTPACMGRKRAQDDLEGQYFAALRDHFDEAPEWCVFVEPVKEEVAS